MKHHNAKGKNWIDNISQGHPVDIALKWKLNAPATQKVVFLDTEIIQG